MNEMNQSGVQMYHPVQPLRSATASSHCDHEHLSINLGSE